MINVVRSHGRERGLHGRYLELEYVEGKGLRAYTGSGARNRFPFCPFSPRAGLLRLFSISPSLLPPSLSYSLSSFSTRIKKEFIFGFRTWVRVVVVVVVEHSDELGVCDFSISE